MAVRPSKPKTTRWHSYRYNHTHTHTIRHSEIIETYTDRET